MSLKFTVVTAVFNAEDVIEKTIKSVLNQTYTPYEYLIIDGKSSDKTVEIIRKYSKHFEEKNITLKIVSEKDNGIYNAMNKGIDLAEGDFISFLNATSIFLFKSIFRLEILSTFPYIPNLVFLLIVPIFF